MSTPYPSSSIHGMDQAMRHLSGMEMDDMTQWLKWLNVVANLHNNDTRMALVNQLDHDFFKPHYPALLAALSYGPLTKDVSAHIKWNEAVIGEDEAQEIYEKRYFIHNAHLPMAPIPNHETSWWIVQTDDRLARNENTCEDAIYLLKELLRNGVLTPQTLMNTTWGGARRMDHIGLAFGWPAGVMTQLWGEGKPHIDDPIVTGLCLVANGLGLRKTSDKREECVERIWEAWREVADPTTVVQLPQEWNTRWSAPQMSLGAAMVAISAVATCAPEMQKTQSQIHHHLDSVIDKLARQSPTDVDRDVLAVTPILIKDLQYEGHVARRFLKTMLARCSTDVKAQVISWVCQSVKPNTIHPLWNILSHCKELKGCLTTSEQANEMIEALMTMHPLTRSKGDGKIINQETFQRFWNNKDKIYQKNFGWSQSSQTITEHFDVLDNMWEQWINGSRGAFSTTPQQNNILLTLETFEPKRWDEPRRLRTPKM